MTAKRPTPRVPRTPQDQARRRLLLDAAHGTLGYSGPISTPRAEGEANRGGR